MKHTSLYLDQQLLADAAAALGTRGTTDTVRSALEEVVRRRRLNALASWDIAAEPERADALRAPATRPRP